MEEKSAATTLVEKNNKGLIEYKVAGENVKLSYDIVRNFLTKGNGQVSDQDLVQFISICKYNQLNPFLNEAYLVKFGQQPAQMIVSKEALMKRAEACETYEGFKAGCSVVSWCGRRRRQRCAIRAWRHVRTRRGRNKKSGTVLCLV